MASYGYMYGGYGRRSSSVQYYKIGTERYSVKTVGHVDDDALPWSTQYGYGDDEHLQHFYGSAVKDYRYGSPVKDYSYGSPVKDYRYGSPVKDYRYGSPVKDYRYGSPVKDYRYGSPKKDGLYVNNGHVHRGPPPPQAVANRRFGYPADGQQTTNAAPTLKVSNYHKFEHPQQYQPSQVPEDHRRSSYPTDYGVQHVPPPQQPPVSDNRRFSYRPTNGQHMNNGVHQHAPPPPQKVSDNHRFGYPRKRTFDDSDEDEEDGEESDGDYTPGAPYYHPKRPVDGYPEHKAQESIIRPTRAAPHNPTTYPGPDSPTRAATFNPTTYPRPNSQTRAASYNPTTYPGPNPPTRAATFNPTTYPGPNSQTRAAPYNPTTYPVPNSQTRAAPYNPTTYPGPNSPTRAVTFNPTTYPGPNSPVGGNVPDSKNSSSVNPIFSKFRDLYLEYHGKPTPSTKNTEDDYKKDSNRTLTKPTDDVDTAVVYFLSEGLNLSDDDPAATNEPLPQPTGPVSSPRKNHIDHPSPVSSPRKNHIDHPTANISSEAAKDGKYSPPPNMIKGKGDYRKFSVPLPFSKPAASEAGHSAANKPVEGNNKISNVMAPTKPERYKRPPIFSSLRTNSNNVQPPPDQTAGSPEAAAASKQNRNLGDQKLPRTMSANEAVEKYKGAFVRPPT